MKRSPLNRKKPLKRGDSELKRTPLDRGDSELKRTPLKPRSKKTERRYREERVPFVKKILSEKPVCERCEGRPSVDVHEKRTRGRTGGVHGDDWLDEDNVAALCRPCHNWIDDNPKQAEKDGWLYPSTY